MVREETLDIPSLVMAVYREPLHYRELFQAQTELPEDVESVLRIASGDTEMIRHYAKALGVAPDRLREAAVFFIEQVFFVRGGNYYRVLGLDTKATETQIKEHHRFLIRLFHPDRHSDQESWADNYARRVNRAYNVLRNSERRQAYDLSLSHMQTENWEDTRTTASLNRSASDTGTSFSFDRRFARQKSHPFDSLRRYLPGIVMGGLAMAAFIFVATVYVANRQFSAPPESLKISKNTIQTQDPPPKNLSGEFPRPILPPKEVRIKQVDSPSQEVEEVTEPVSRPRSTPTIPVFQRSEGITEPVSKPRSIPTTLSREPADRPLSATELRLFLGRFISAYERGSLDEFMMLFADQARAGDKVNKTGIRQDYRAVFQKTQTRRISLSHLRWRQAGKMIYGNGRFSVKMSYRDKSAGHQYSGNIRFELGRKNDDGLIIYGLYHLIDDDFTNESLPVRKTWNRDNR